MGQKRHPAAADRVTEWTRAGARGAVVMGSNPAQSINFFSALKKFLSFWRASYQYSKSKISSTGVGTIDTALFYVQSAEIEKILFEVDDTCFGMYTKSLKDTFLT